MAIAAIGSKFQRWDGLAWVSIAEISSILGPNMSKDVVDITSVYSPGGYREFMSGLRNSGTISLAMNFSFLNYTLMKGDYESEILGNYRIILSDVNQTTIEFEAIVLDLPLSIPADDKITITSTLQCSGQVIVNGVQFSYIPESSDVPFISADPYVSIDPSVDPPIFTGTQLATPNIGTVTAVNMNCIRCTVSAIDNRASNLEISYKKIADVNWVVWSSVMQSTERFALIYGLDQGTSYQVRWRAIGDGINFTSSAYSTTTTGQTQGLYAVVVYIDPTYAGANGASDGSILRPLVDFPSAIAAGTSYLVKRGTTLNRTTAIGNVIGVTGFHIGAYGTGVRPKIVRTTNGRMLDIYIPTINGVINLTDVEFYIPRATADGGPDVIFFHNIGAATANVVNCLIDGGFQGILSDPAQGGTYRIIGCTVQYQWSDNIAIWGRDVNIATTLELAYCSLSFANYSGTLAPYNGDNAHIMSISNIHTHHNIMDRSNNDNKFCYIQSYHAAMVLTSIIEYNTFTRQRAGNMSLVYLQGIAGSSTQMRYNVFKNADLGIQDDSIGFQAYGNLFYNITAVQRVVGGTSLYYNNTFYNCACFDYVNPGNGVGYGYGVLTFRNNIFHSFGTTLPMFATPIGGGSRSSDYNCFYNITNRNCTLGVQDLTINPLMVSPSTSNFNLQPTSPCIGTGLYIAGYTFPFPVDRGAAKFVGAGLVAESFDPIIVPSYIVAPRLNTPTAGAAILYGQTCIRVNFTNQDYRAAAYTLEYKTQASAVWLIWSSSIKSTENFCEVFGLEPNTQYNFRWRALGDGINFENSFLSAIITGITEFYPNPVYIDPVYAGANGASDGSITRPYTNIPAISTDLLQEFSYLLKRGTVLNRGELHIARTGLHFGAYGTGVRPQWRFNGTAAKLLWFAITNSAGNVNISDIDFFSSFTGVSHAVMQFGTCGAITVRVINCYIEGGDQGIRGWNSPSTVFRIIGTDITKSWSDGIFVAENTANASDLLEVGYCSIYDVNISNPNLPDDGDCVHSVDIRVVHCHHTNMNHSSKPGKFCYINSIVNGTIALNTVEYCTLQRTGPNDAQTLMYTMSLNSVGSVNNIRYNQFFNAGVGLQHAGQLVNVHHNLFYNLGNAFDNESSLTSVENYYNNTFYSCNKIIIDNGADIVLRNNIFHTVPGSPAIISPAAGATRSSNYNCYFNVTDRNVTLGLNDITTNPQFTNAASQDFSLLAISPCVGAGLFISGYTRPAPVDMGAIQLQSPVGESSDAIIAPASEDLPTPTAQLVTPSMGVITNYTPTCIKITVSGVDVRTPNLKLEYKRASAAAWDIWTDTMMATETFALVYGLEPNTIYNFRWRALGMGAYIDSAYSAVSSPNTQGWLSARPDGLPNYIDPTYAGANGASDGSILRPWVVRPAFASGNTYLFRRGTTYTHTLGMGFLYGSTGIAIGAYGTGARPRIVYTNTNHFFEFKIRSVAASNNISIQDVDILYTGTPEKSVVLLDSPLGIGAHNVYLINCFMQGGTNSIRSEASCANMALYVVGCELCNVWSDSIFIVTGAAYTGANRNVSVEVGYCFIHHVNEYARITGAAKTLTDGDNVHLYGVTSTHIHHSDIDHSTANNKFCVIISGVSTTTFLVEYNNLSRFLDGSNDACFYLEGVAAGSYIIRYNVIRDAGLGVQNSSVPYLQMYGNTCYNLDVVYIGGTSRDVLFYNNTVYNCRILFSTYGSVMTIRNNIFHTNVGTTAAYLVTPTDRTTNYNCYFNINNRNIPLGLNDITVDPLFVSAAQRNFQLQVGSPCRGNGVVIAGYTKASNVDRGSGLSVWTDYPDSVGEGGGWVN